MNGRTFPIQRQVATNKNIECRNIVHCAGNKLELSWAKLSLAGAMVFGLGMVEI